MNTLIPLHAYIPPYFIAALPADSLQWASVHAMSRREIVHGSPQSIWRNVGYSPLRIRFCQGTSAIHNTRHTQETHVNDLYFAACSTKYKLTARAELAATPSQVARRPSAFGVCLRKLSYVHRKIYLRKSACKLLGLQRTKLYKAITYLSSY